MKYFTNAGFWGVFNTSWLKLKFIIIYLTNKSRLRKFTKSITHYRIFVLSLYFIPHLASLQQIYPTTRGKDLNPILTTTLHTGIFLGTNLCRFPWLPAAADYLCLKKKKMTRPLAPAVICRLPKLHISSHFWVACCSKTVSTSQ